MKRRLILFIVLTSSFVNAQDTISTETVRPFVHSFSIENSKFSGKGGEILINEIQNSQFVLIGETHGNADISEFTTCIIPVAKENGFNHFFTENGNVTLQQMIQSAQSSPTIKTGLHQFYSKEYQRVNGIALPFFWGVEDAAFLEAALENDMSIDGIDQEHYNSFPLLFDQLFELSSKTSEIKDAHASAIQYLLQEYENDRKQKDYPLFVNFRSSRIIKDFFGLLDPTNAETGTIISDIKESWFIYELHSLDRSASLQMRGELMDRKFQGFFDQFSNNESLPKVLIKMGGLHTMRGETPLGIFDIGDKVAKLAKTNNTLNLNLYFMFRYYLDDEEPLGYFDNAEGDSDWLKQRKPFMEQGHPEEWRLIDLKSLNAFLAENELFIYEPLQSILDHRDYLIIPPATRDIELNYSK